MNWDNYDLTKTVMKTDLPDEDIKKMCRIIYQLHASQSHIIKLIKNIKS